MPVLPSSLALTVIPDGSPIIAADHRNNYAAVQAGVNALIAILDNGNGVDGDPLVWDATNAKWAAASRLPAGRPRPARIVTSLMSGGPPASPVDGDIWIATAVDANGTRWTFQYNAGSASAYKWEFIGGQALYAYTAADVAFAGSGAWVLTGDGIPVVNTSRPGDYLIDVRAIIHCTVAATVFFGVANTQINTTPLGAQGAAFGAAGTVYVEAVSQTKAAGCPAVSTFLPVYNTGTAGQSALHRTVAVTPIRVS